VIRTRSQSLRSLNSLHTHTNKHQNEDSKKNRITSAVGIQQGILGFISTFFFFFEKKSEGEEFQSQNFKKNKKRERKN
jgi:hypothetical protein